MLLNNNYWYKCIFVFVFWCLFLLISSIWSVISWLKGILKGLATIFPGQNLLAEAIQNTYKSKAVEKSPLSWHCTNPFNHTFPAKKNKDFRNTYKNKRSSCLIVNNNTEIDNKHIKEVPQSWSWLVNSV